MVGTALLGGVMDTLTQYTFLGNHLGQWLALLGILLVSFILGKILGLLLVRQANRLGKVEGWTMLELLIRCLERPLTLVVLAGGLYVAGQFMTLEPAHLALWINGCMTIAVLSAAWLLYRMVDVLEHLLTRWTSKTDTKLDDQLVPLLRKTMRVFVVIVAVLFIADNVFRWDVGALVAGLGIGGLAFALASKDMLANLFGSVTIFADRPFGMGERVKISGHDGTVEEVGFRSTRIRLLNGHLVTIPNATVANSTIENVSRRPSIKRVLDVTVTYDTSPERVQRAVDILREMLDARAEHFPPDLPGRVHFTDFNAESLNIQVTYWFAPPEWEPYLDFTHAFNMELLQRYNAEGIEFAFPTQTLYVKQDSALPAPDPGAAAPDSE